MLERAEQQIKRAGRQLGLDQNTIAGLLEPDAEHQFEITLVPGKQLKAYRVQHKNIRGPYKGGIRFHPEVSLEETRALATLMSLKTAAMDLPLGGGKGGVAVDPKKLENDEIEKISREYVRQLHRHIGPDKDIPAPDVNTNTQVIDWMVDEYERQTGDTSHASFTGKSIESGGSLGREAATGRGGVVALSELLKQTGKAGPIAYAVQGFGNVGAFFATVAAQDHPDWKLIAASDSSATLSNPSGLPAQKLADFKAQHKQFKKYSGNGIAVLASPEVFEHKVDVLVLAALGDTITEKNVKTLQVKYVIEMANGPINTDALDYLTKRGITILPDIIANAGGVVVSYLEWRQNKSGEHWSEAKVNRTLHRYMVQAVHDVLDAAERHKVPGLTEAAFLLALERLVSG